MTTLPGYEDTPTGRRISELAALLAKECPLDKLRGSVQKTADDPLHECYAGQLYRIHPDGSRVNVGACPHFPALCSLECDVDPDTAYDARGE